MRTQVGRRRAAVAAVIAASGAMLAACGPQAGTAAAPDAGLSAAPSSTAPSVTATGSAGAGPGASASAAGSAAVKPAKPVRGTALVSNGTRTVWIGGVAVQFPTTVTGAQWLTSERIAFVDGDGNISTARYDGSARKVLTKTDRNVRRSNLTAYARGRVDFELHAGGKVRIRTVVEDPTTVADGPEFDAFIGADQTPGDLGNTAPDSRSDLNETYTYEDAEHIQYAYGHQGSGGEEIWVVDGNSREPMASKAAMGSSPAVSPDGSKVAYVGRDEQVHVVSVAAGKRPSAPGALTDTRLTSGEHGIGQLTWTVDGRVAYSRGSAIEAVAANHTVTQIWGAAGTVDFLQS